MSRPRSLNRAGSAIARALVAGALAVGLLWFAEPHSAVAAPTASDVVRAADDGEAELSVAIVDVAPQVLREGRRLTLRGTLSNTGAGEWHDIRVHLAVPRNPMTLFHEIDTAFGNAAASTATARSAPRIMGRRVTAAVDRISPATSVEWSVTVPYDRLGILGAEGVYPVTVHVVGTDASGQVHDEEPAALATTFLPLVGEQAARVPANVIVPLAAPTSGEGLQPRQRTADELPRITRIVTAAEALPASARTVVLDPELLDLIAAAGDDDLLASIRRLMASSDSYVLDYAHPDETSLAMRGSEDLDAAVQRATLAAIDRWGLPDERAARVEAGMVSETILARSNEPVIFVSTADIPEWKRTDGRVVSTSRRSLVIDDPLPGPGARGSAAVVRQRLLAESALTEFTRRLDPAYGGEVSVMLAASWDPGPHPADLATAFSERFVEPTTVASLRQSATPHDGPVGDSSIDRRLSSAHVHQAREILREGDVMARVDTSEVSALVEVDQLVAAALSTRWIQAPRVGLAAAEDVARGFAAEVDQITVSGPGSVTLSSATGSFPLTISNQTTRAVRVGIGLEASNDGVSVGDVPAVDIAAGERLTVDVDIDMRNQQSTVMLARPSDPEGVSFGTATDFNVRASNVGAIIWFAMAAAAIAFVVTITRRFLHGRRTARAASPPDATPTRTSAP